MSYKSREVDDGSLVVNEGDIVIVSNERGKKNGIFARVGMAELLEGQAIVAFHPVIDDKTRHRGANGLLLPNLSPEKSALLIGKPDENFVKGQDFSVSVPNRLDKIRYSVGKKL